jgi:Fe-S cluster assembly protein SufD
LFRNRITGTLLGAGAEMDVAALDQVDDWDQAHRRIHVRHAVGHTQSRQLFKTVLAHRGAKTSFDGLIQIDVGADGSDAEQLSKNLILVGGARADAKPQLDVHADEVKAAHGATVGQLDPDEVLYLRMRGIPAVDATGLLKHGFSGEVLERLNPQSLALFAETP